MIGVIWAMVPGPIRRALAWVLAAGVALIGLRFAFRREVKRETALEAAERYAKTRKDIDDATDTLGDDPAVLREWLRERGQSKRDL